MGWEPPVLVSHEPGSEVRVAGMFSLGNEGRAAVYELPDGIWMRRFVTDSGWQQPELIDPDTGYDVSLFELQGFPNGERLAVWLRGADLWFSRFAPGTGWGSASRFYSFSGNLPYPLLIGLIDRDRLLLVGQQTRTDVNGQPTSVIKAEVLDIR